MNLDYPIRELGPIFTRLKVKNSQHFTQETWRQNFYQTHSKTQCIFLRHWKDRDQKSMEFEDYPLLPVYRESLKNVLIELDRYYNFVDYSAIITNLKAGASIPLHKDGGEIFEATHRIHIPIVTNPDVWFHCGELCLNMLAYHAYEIGNTNHVHGVTNSSNHDRYHLIIDLLSETIAGDTEPPC